MTNYGITNKQTVRINYTCNLYTRIAKSVKYLLLLKTCDLFKGDLHWNI